MAIEDFPLNLLGKALSSYDIGSKFAEVNNKPGGFEEYLITEGFHCISEVPHNSEPLNNGTLDEEFVWIPQSHGNARCFVMLPLSNDKTIVYKKFNTRLLMTFGNEIIGIARCLGFDKLYEYFQFDFGPDLVPSGALLHYDNKIIPLIEPLKRLGNGIKERFLEQGGAGIGFATAAGSRGFGIFGGIGGGGGSKNGNPLPGAPVGFLWKPISDSTGKLAVLYPENLGRGCTVAGESGRDGGVGNGDRWHARFSKPGAAYGDNVPCVCPFGTIIIPYGALRWEGTGG